jgi:hypothetical protein
MITPYFPLYAPSQMIAEGIPLGISKFILSSLTSRSSNLNGHVQQPADFGPIDRQSEKTTEEMCPLSSPYVRIASQPEPWRVGHRESLRVSDSLPSEAVEGALRSHESQLQSDTNWTCSSSHVVPVCDKSLMLHLPMAAGINMANSLLSLSSRTQNRRSMVDCGVPQAPCCLLIEASSRVRDRKEIERFPSEEHSAESKCTLARLLLLTLADCSIHVFVPLAYYFIHVCTAYKLLY